MTHRIVQELEQAQIKPDRGDFQIGDTVDVHVRIVEGEKERLQVFTGIVIGRRGKAVNEYFTVRRLVGGEGVERMFPLNSTRIDRIVVKKRGKVRRAKLYYLRDRSGKATKVAERRAAGRSGIEVPGSDQPAPNLGPAQAARASAKPPAPPAGQTPAKQG